MVLLSTDRTIPNKQIKERKQSTTEMMLTFKYEK